MSEGRGASCKEENIRRKQHRHRSQHRGDEHSDAASSVCHWLHSPYSSDCCRSISPRRSASSACMRFSLSFATLAAKDALPAASRTRSSSCFRALATKRRFACTAHTQHSAEERVSVGVAHGSTQSARAVQCCSPCLLPMMPQSRLPPAAPALPLWACAGAQRRPLLLPAVAVLLRDRAVHTSRR